MNNKNNDKSIIQNLKDAGCDDETINDFMNAIRNEKTNAGLKLLAIYRRSLLDNLHKNQKQIDCLDYLVYTMQKKL